MADTPAQAEVPTTTPSDPFGWGCLLLIFVLGLLLVIDPVAFGAGVAAVFIVGALWGISAQRAGDVQRLRREWILSWPSPLRQEVTITAARKCSVGSSFLGNQSMSYRYDVVGADGNVEGGGRPPAGAADDAARGGGEVGAHQRPAREHAHGAARRHAPCVSARW